MTVWTDLGHLPIAIRYEQVGGWTTRTMVCGTGPALILMHGTGGHLEAFSRNVAPLAEHFRVIAYDFPGQGLTSQATVDLELPAYLDHVRRLMEALDLTRAHLCGESLGGWVAIKFAAQYPDLVNKLVLNTPGGTMATPEVMERIRSLSQAAADDPTDARIRARLEWLMADPASVTDELVSIRQGIYARPGFAESMRHVLCLQDPEIRNRNLVTPDELSAVTAPTLVIWTSHDPSGPAAAGRAMAEGIPNAEFRLIENAGHWPQWEQPEEYNASMLEFLTRT